jgi:DNA (cytosine-5)-methyltransferase 1
MKRPTLTVIDFFSGAGGFSEGFRQQGFKVVKGIDFWEPAVKTHNLNHGLNDVPENVLDYVGADSADVERIEALPDVDVIIGSPSCVTFSLSNKGGKADKTEGIRLIEAYLRIIAVKKHKKDSLLKAWLMENVPNSGNYVRHEYTFTDLHLEKWARANDIAPKSVALTLNGVVLNASDYGAPQNRNRFICGETVSDGQFPQPTATTHVMPTLGDIKSKMPKPNSPSSDELWEDPNYPGLHVKTKEISDHFYDTGLYINQWEQAHYLKTMHPFMGKMSFPENEGKASRTITATRSSCTRESIVYKSEFARTGHGEYRAPTIREAASLMGYPYTYQFFGSEGLKWKQIGNSVSPQLSAALAKAILVKEGRKPVRLEKVNFSKQKDLYLSVDNLNTFAPRTFDEQKQRKSGARFRRSLHKSQNMTVDLLNYLPGKNEVGTGWYVCAFYGTGSYQYDLLKNDAYQKLRKILEQEYDLFDEFLSEINKNVTDDTLSPQTMQYAYENDAELSDKDNPLVIVKKIQQVVDKYAAVNSAARFVVSGMVRLDFSLAQLLYMFSLTYIIYNNLQEQTISVSEKSLAYEL